MSDWDGTATEDSLAQAREAIVGEVPLMSQPPDSTVTLFRGLLQGNIWRTDAEVRELSGEDEEIVARAMNADDSLGYVNATIVQGLARIGTLDVVGMPAPQRRLIIDQLLLGEKELLFLRVLGTTFGDTRTVSATCPSCQEVFEVDFSLSTDIPLKGLEDPTRTSYEFKMRDGTILEYRLVTGADQFEATKRKGALTPEQNTIMLSRVILSLNGKPLLDPLHFARSMNAGDRRKLLDEVNDLQPGPYFEEVKLPCPECGVEASFAPSWADLL